MFSGIVQTIGRVVSNRESGRGRRLEVEAGGLDIERVSVGDSIAVNGVCLTVASIDRSILKFDVSGESVSKSLIKNWTAETMVNLETALTPESLIGGHLVSGHIDGTGTLVESRNDGEFSRFVFEIDKSSGYFIAPKGSVAVDGVSLTSNAVADSQTRTAFDVMLVPHTLKNTTLGSLNHGDDVHVETDQIARYVHRMTMADVHE